MLITDVLFEKIQKLKKDKNAVILAHTYQNQEIQEVADFVGDSLDLSLKVKETDADVIVFCGVYFMAETAKLISPDKRVILPVKSAGCPMADMVSASDLIQIKKENPEAVIVTYINSSADVKAYSDICCTSANAVDIINSIPIEKEIYFVPDMNLATYVKKLLARDNIKIWPGHCAVHSKITVKDVLNLKEKYPYAVTFAHPECRTDVLKNADFVLSTSQMIKEAANHGDEYIIITENGILTPLIGAFPNKTFHTLDKAKCVNMKKTRIEDLLNALENLEFEIKMDSDIIQKASKSVYKMLEIK